MPLLVRLVLAHVIGDGVLQTREIADGKRKRPHILLLHAGVIAATAWVMTGHWGEAVSWQIAASAGAVHGCIDLLKAWLARLFARPNGLLSSRADRILDRADQASHFLSLVVIASFFSRG